jgi:hypothetical protein
VREAQFPRSRRTLWALVGAGMYEGVCSALTAASWERIQTVAERGRSAGSFDSAERFASRIVLLRSG